MTNLEKTPKVGEILDIPIYMGKSPTSIKDLLAAGEDVFFILGYEKSQASGSTAGGSRTGLHLIRRNLVGYAATPVSDQGLGLNQQLVEQATFVLPKIPWELQQKMSRFFHRAFELHGSEAVLLLLYNENYLNTEHPEDGWGCIAPDQENTGGSCHYTNDSVMSRKADYERIVGSAHSHPEMTAFFSSTDHNDQADWDGLHITYAWRKNGPDEFHIEMVMSGKQYPFKPEDIFARPPVPELGETEEIEEWVSYVKKKQYSSHSSGTTSTHGTKVTGSSFVGTSLSRANKRNRPLAMPKEGPNPSNSVLIGLIPRDTEDLKEPVLCPLCRLSLIRESIAAARCFGCKSFLAFEGESIDEYAQRYATLHNTVVDLLDVDKSPKPIHTVWREGDTVKWSDDLRSATAKK